MKLGKTFAGLVLSGLMVCVIWGGSAVGQEQPDQLWEQLAEISDVPVVITTESGEQSFSVEVARTIEAKAQGLMYRPSMPEDHSMLFLYDNPRRASFWMKNTFIPLDIIYIRANGRIANIAKNTTPKSENPISSRGRVKYILEINAGLSDKLGIKQGDLVSHPAMKLNK